MNQDFLLKLLDKPTSYLLAWAYFYAHADEKGVFMGNPNGLQSRFKVSRTSLQRIVDFGVEWAENGQKVGRKWANNELIIMGLYQVSGQKVGRKWAESGQKIEEKESKKVNPKEELHTPENATYEPVIEEKKKRKASDKLYPQMVEAYNTFCEKQVGMGAKMNAHQGKAMKSIIEYLKLQVIKKIGAEDIEQVQSNIIKAWEYILNNWNAIKGYYHDQIKLSQIDSNLPVILMQLKQAKTTKRDEQYANTTSEIGRTSFE